MGRSCSTAMLCAMLSCTGSVHGQTAANETPTNLVVTVLGNPAPSIGEKVAWHIASECPCSAVFDARTNSLLRTVESQVDALAQDHAWVLGLIDSPTGKSAFRGGLFRKRGVALLDMNSLKDTAAGGSDSSDLLESRVLKESMRSFGFLLGLKDCPWPRCCMFPAPNEKDLDAKGRDFCPPCQVKVDRILSGEAKAQR
ncbi:MAG: hypothetical protein ISS31_03255 [Kiritimatiellae bacterium]|nr:hypothetical protein [Kiritimatiellia bacterium]